MDVESVISNPDWTLIYGAPFSTLMTWPERMKLLDTTPSSTL